jgi:hypothetical protein
MCPSDFSDELFESMTSTTEQIPASHELRDSVLSQTTRTVRNRRRMRRAGIAAALIGCYLGGIATSSLRPANRETRPFDANSAAADNSVAAADLATAADPAAGNGKGNAEAPVRKPVRPEDDQIVVSSVRPATSRLTRYERLRQTGDEQLEKFADIPGATRSYQRALQIASSDQRRIAPDRDTWLLMALKHSSNL